MHFCLKGTLGFRIICRDQTKKVLNLFYSETMQISYNNQYLPWLIVPKCCITVSALKGTIISMSYHVVLQSKIWCKFPATSLTDKFLLWYILRGSIWVPQNLVRLLVIVISCEGLKSFATNFTSKLWLIKSKFPENEEDISFSISPYKLLSKNSASYCPFHQWELHKKSSIHSNWLSFTFEKLV